MFELQEKLLDPQANHLQTNSSVEAGFDGFPKSYTRWKMHSLRSGYQSAELLTDVVCRQGVIDEFHFLKRKPTITSDCALASIKTLAPWTYYLNISGIDNRDFSTYKEETITYHRYRNDLITNNLLKLFSNDVEKLTALDIGCNCGFFTLELAARGFSSVTGVDLRSENIAQAEFARNAMNLCNASFLELNVKDLPVGKKFDIVLNLGLMYHLSTPLEVMKKCYEITNKVCVIDSVTHKEPFSSYFVLSDKNINSPIEGDLSFELQPTYRALLETIYSAGFKCVLEVMTIVDVNIEQYGDLSRRCFFAFKDEELGATAVQLLNSKNSTTS
jgi:SAM-dependent methyltransferase